MEFQGRRYSPGDFTHLWYRRPEALRDDRYSDPDEGKFALDEWSAMLEGFFAHIPRERWMNHPSSNFSASNKLEQLSLASSLGFLVPETLVTQDKSCLRAFFDDCGGRAIVKPLSVGYVEKQGENDSLIYTNQILESHLDELKDLEACPTFFQHFIAKSADFRITVVDEEIHVAELLASDLEGSQRCDIRRNNMVDVETRKANLPPGIEEKIRLLMRHYNLRFGAIDMAITTEGKWVFFEINPNGQWAWMDIAADFHIADSFVRSFQEKK